MTTPTLAVLGCGNMASAIIKGCAPSSKKFRYVTYTPTWTRAKVLADAIGGTTVTSLSKLPPCDFYFIACKPQQCAELAKGLNPVLNPKGVVISVMAGVTIAKMKSLFPRAEKFVRTMPNTPCFIGEGVTGIAFTPNMTSQEQREVKGLFETVSKVFVFDDEESLDVVVAATGSGPAYVFEVANQLIQKMVAMGIQKETALAMIVQLFIGSSLLMAKSAESPEELRNKVTSKGGTTEAALKVFQDYKLGDIFAKALDAAFTRAKELSKL